MATAPANHATRAWEWVGAGGGWNLAVEASTARRKATKAATATRDAGMAIHIVRAVEDDESGLWTVRRGELLARLDLYREQLDALAATAVELAFAAAPHDGGDDEGFGEADALGAERENALALSARTEGGSPRSRPR